MFFLTILHETTCYVQSAISTISIKKSGAIWDSYF